MAAKFRNAGQACIAANRIFVHRSIYDEFSKLLVEKIESNLLCGDGFSGSATLGPLINQSGLDKVGVYTLSRPCICILCMCILCVLCISSRHVKYMSGICGGCILQSILHVSSVLCMVCVYAVMMKRTCDL